MGSPDVTIRKQPADKLLQQPVGKQPAKNSFEAEFQRAKELLLETNRPDLAASAFATLLKTMHTFPELWLFYAVALDREGLSDQAAPFFNKYNEWKQKNNNLPKASLLTIQCSLLTNNPNEASFRAESILSNSQFLARFSPKERKQLYYLAGTAIMNQKFPNTEVEKAEIEKAKRFLKCSLDEPATGPEENYLEYRCHLQIAKIDREIGIKAHGTEAKYMIFIDATVQLDKALEIKPFSKEACKSYESTVEAFPAIGNVPESCLNLPEDPANETTKNLWSCKSSKQKR